MPEAPEAPMNKHGHERCCHDDPAEYHQAKLPRSQRDDAHSQAAEQTVQNDSKLHRTSSREPTQAKLLLTEVNAKRRYIGSELRNQGLEKTG